MRGLSSNFGDQLLWAAAVGMLSLAVAGIVASALPKAGRPRMVSRVLAAGSVLIVVLATATGPVSTDGDLVLEPGRAGLGDLDQIVADPTSLAGVLLLSNVLLYVPVGFFGALGWRFHPWPVLVAALLLSLSIETAQYLFLGRVASTDDVLLNSFGALIGFLAATGAARLRSSSRD